jgi:hypothetical protein
MCLVKMLWFAGTGLLFRARQEYVCCVRRDFLKFTSAELVPEEDRGVYLAFIDASGEQHCTTLSPASREYSKPPLCVKQSHLYFMRLCESLIVLAPKRACCARPHRQGSVESSGVSSKVQDRRCHHRLSETPSPGGECDTGLQTTKFGQDLGNPQSPKSCPNQPGRFCEDSPEIGLIFALHKHAMIWVPPTTKILPRFWM